MTAGRPSDKLMVIDGGTHTGPAGGESAHLWTGSAPGFSSAPPKGEDVAWLDSS